MPWSRDDDDRDQGFNRPRGPKVCVTCRKIILRLDDLVKRRDETDRKELIYCSKCAPEVEDASNY